MALRPLQAMRHEILYIAAFYLLPSAFYLLRPFSKL